MAKSPEPNDTITTRYHYSPPWADLSIIGVAGSSGSGKSSISDAIVRKLNLPWVVILSMVSPNRFTWQPLLITMLRPCIYLLEPQTILHSSILATLSSLSLACLFAFKKLENYNMFYCTREKKKRRINCRERLESVNLLLNRICGWLTHSYKHQDSFYKSLDAESSKKAFANEYDFDAPDAIDFDALVNLLRDLKAGYVDFNDFHCPVPSGPFAHI